MLCICNLCSPLSWSKKIGQEKQDFPFRQTIKATLRNESREGVLLTP